ncbi:DNA-3-methyladenine glycosylase family protein [Turicimonas muris]|uniref:DNA-3-methyladenine glycosylase II n=3 Tax=Turicimonas muris TaxID=1796652 RepID=A0A227KRP9_9BURK|nr:DNA-3-methyladenine glycosylase [Turicimonas muris]ANU65647.1 DNA-3-methyladenine glycosidase [Burkholderiales bacterium YL45]OXE50396.1 DNA-3-methyladenine glycosylase 2 family protein [Turicimonas muris]QQQ96793.1 DNA-3-methyladenine glycosylase 2 family protein [Turicimonas muris]
MKDEAFFVYGKKEISYFKAKDKRLGKVIDKVVHIERETIPDLFSALVHSIVGQQISTKDHSTIWQRMENELGYPLIPTHIAGLDKETLQTFGITFKKEEYIKVAAKKVVDGDLDIERLRFLSDNEVCKELVKLDGIGVWTAEMLLIFSMRRPNILSFGDLAILRGMRMVYHHRQISKKLFEKYKKRLSPYASVASLYFWAVAGGAVLEMKDYATKKRSLKR